VGDGTLKGKFSKLYKVSYIKDFLVCELTFRIDNGSTQEYIWQVPGRMELFDWKKDLKKQLLEIINMLFGGGDSFDRWCWVDEKTERLTQSNLVIGP